MVKNTLPILFLSRLRVSVQRTSSVDNELLLYFSKSRFLCMQCQKISVFLFKDGAGLRMKSFSCKQSLHTLSPGANGFTFLTTSHIYIYIYIYIYMGEGGSVFVSDRGVWGSVCKSGWCVCVGSVFRSVWGVWGGSVFRSGWDVCGGSVFISRWGVRVCEWQGCV